MRRVGAVGGAAATYALLRRRKPAPGFGATIGFTILGSIAGGGLLMPAGVMWGKADMQNVEDPSHFARVLQGAADERQGRIAPGTAQNGMGNAGPVQANRPQQFGQQGGSNGSSYPNFPPPSQSTRRTPQPSSSNNQSNQWGDDSFDESALWAQIRGDRSEQPSSWERLRQQNAREAYEKRNGGAGQEKEMNDVGSRYGAPQAQREFEASFDRERRGIDG
ncbi:uncharacterized protein FA14DRAFT_147062 [Meira miltonrushii]|uniref:Uncharacterized protein n=1 Tax=Meira miltonrushii TaxID=1280837 RepID=A0A316V6W7_9BASI|nr:uncharacterized protein FA14DRAFT_147062 [Meira miltonrushii]PWN33280.1 hypothetical protein FA14DRAFT_147062 [Meira miltonrushii]